MAIWKCASLGRGLKCGVKDVRAIGGVENAGGEERGEKGGENCVEDVEGDLLGEARKDSRAMRKGGEGWLSGGGRRSGHYIMYVTVALLRNILCISAYEIKDYFMVINSWAAAFRSGFRSELG